MNALAQGTLRPFTQELWVEHPTFQLRGRHSVTELFALWYLQVAFNLSNKTLNILTMKNFSISKQVLTKQCDYILALYYFGAGGGGKTIVTCCCAILWGGGKMIVTCCTDQLDMFLKISRVAIARLSPMVAGLLVLLL